MTDLRDQLQGTLGTAYTLERELGVGGMAHDSWPRRWKTWRATLPLPGKRSRSGGTDREPSCRMYQSPISGSEQRRDHRAGLCR
jgi:hypothetical protein